MYCLSKLLSVNSIAVSEDRATSVATKSVASSFATVGATLVSEHSHTTSPIISQPNQGFTLGETFTPLPQANGERVVRLENNSNAADKKTSQRSIVATCVSSSGNTIAIVRETEFFIYKTDSKRLFTSLPTYTGKFADEHGTWRAGRYGPNLNFHGNFLQNASNCRFGMASISDEILGTGSFDYEWIAFFSISDSTPGRCIYKCENIINDPKYRNLTVQRILINHQGNEAVVLFNATKSRNEICRFYSISKSTPASPIASNRNTSTTDVGEHWQIREEKDVVNGIESSRLPFLKTRAAKYSQDDKRIVSCTGHSCGTSLVSILEKEDKEGWRLWGRREINFILDAWDGGCLGFTEADL